MCELPEVELVCPLVEALELVDVDALVCEDSPPDVVWLVEPLSEVCFLPFPELVVQPQISIADNVKNKTDFFILFQFKCSCI